MHFQLKKIILWPNNIDNIPRELVFEPGMLNVITGASRTGKSAIIPIIDYCLGSSNCNIPVDVIRDSCSWFGIIAGIGTEQLLLARKTPEGNVSSSEMYVLRGNKIDVPSVIDGPNNTVINVKSILDGIAGIPYIRVDAEDGGINKFKSHASFRDFVSFNFQPQNIVANQNVLFYKVDSYEYRERLKNVFPFALGAITAEILAKQYELKKLRGLLQKKESELKKLKQISERWVAEIKANVSKTVEYGLWPQEADSRSEDIDYLVKNLRQISGSPKPNIMISGETVDSTVNKIKELRVEENDLSYRIAELRNSLYEMDKLKTTLDQHNGVSSLKRDRLRLSEWLNSAKKENQECPICGSISSKSQENLNELCKAFHEFEIEANSSLEIPSAFHREYEKIKDDIRVFIEKQKSTQKQLQALELSTDKQKQERYRRDGALRFLGTLDNSLDTFSEIQQDSDLAKEIESLNEKIKELSDDVSEYAVEKRINTALKKISRIIASVLPSLDVEQKYINAPCELSIADLSLKIQLDTGVQHFLSQIGSGSNWVSYHIALTVALQKLFTHTKGCPVASFVVYDQPSQVYFPRRLAYEGKDGQQEQDWAKELDEDVEAVKKIFSSLAIAIGADKGEWQGIVLDHAPETVWGSIPNVHLVEEWRDGKKLIPEEWYK